jgi:hypothetical protein
MMHGQRNVTFEILFLYLSHWKIAQAGGKNSQDSDDIISLFII